MSETMGLAVMAGMMVVILLQVAVLLRGNRRQDDEQRFRVLQETQEKGLMRLERELREELARGRREDAEEAFRDREERAQSSTLLSQAVTTQVGQFGALQAERLEAFARELNRFSLGLDERFERLKLTVEGRLTAMQADNANKLEEMRRTVDEKLHATLEQRLGESFKLVSDRLEQVHRGLGEMQTLAAGVGDLKRVLTNVKTRGTWGEVQLSALLEQLLTADQFAANVATKPGSGERVDFAIRLPGKEDGAEVWLPLDAKFPIEDYQRLIDAQEPAAIEEAAKAIEVRLKNEAKSIREKYVAPPHTTDFAILYLPIEGLYAEALRRPGLAEVLQRNYRVSLAGPTTLAAMLNSLQMGFRTLAIEQRSAEVWAVLGAVKTEFGKFGEALAHTRKKLDEASNSIAKAETRTRQLSRKLKEVEALPVADSEQLIGGADFDGEDE
ncbi:DNA recombination protein RmuC [Dechloromonas sp. CZR5]|uniref:DNA recombination protein RmuC n=1 Tax=Dechloromonas sp. CZR5 TaxID=2608630 RepID=UPI00168BA97C|nr:DNA recombination protein RmuC [Dechloromonas sp. CZR5]